MAKRDAKTLLKNGWIHILVTLEILGKPQEHVDATLRQLIDTIRTEEARVEVLEEHVEPAEASADGFFSAYAEIDMLAKDVEQLTWLAATYTPASIEIIEPLEFSFTAGDLQSWYMNILETMHSIGYAHKTQTSELAFVKGQLRALIENALLLSLGRSPKKVEQLVSDTSIDAKAVEAHLGSLEKAKKVTQQGGTWKLA